MRVRVEHQQGSRSGVETGHVVQSHVQLLHELHVLRIHRNVLDVREVLKSHHVLLVNLAVDLLGIRLSLLRVETACRYGCNGRVGTLRDEQLHTTTLGCILQRLRLLRLDERQRVEGIAQRGDAPEAVLLLERVREVEHVTRRNVGTAALATVREPRQVVRPQPHVVAATRGTPQRNRLVGVRVALDIHKTIAAL